MFFFLSSASVTGTSYRFIAKVKEMMKIKVLKGFESRCQGTKQAAGIAGTKALEQKKQDVSTGMAKKSSFPFLHLTRGFYRG